MLVNPPGAAVPEAAGSRIEYVQSLDRGLAVIRAFSADTPRLSIADVARQTGLTRAAARRFLHTLCGLGYVGVNGGSYYLRPRVLELGYAYLSSVSVAEIAQEHLVALAEELHESCSASVLDGADIVYIARAQTNRIMTISLTVGTRLPAYATSMGRVLLAALPDDRLDAFFAGATFQPLTEHTVTDPQLLRKELDKVRERGWCAIDQELEVGVRSVAVPVSEADGRVVAAVNATAHAARVPLPRLTEQFLPKLTEAARHINADLAARH
ncbi:MAG TPA: IclR family transcriptional regulator C-terminal domain-containing protein [Actinomycetes bacterium]|nr:IclR family transcriptional regulator C-terminal domain-containing protein [Actinomycetes bacterium]